MNRHQQDITAYLVEENRVLKEQLKGRKLRLSDEQRRRLAAKAKRLGRQSLNRGATPNPDESFMAQVARNLTDAVDDPQRQRDQDLEVRVSSLASTETVLRWRPRGDHLLAQPDRDVAAAPEATLVLPSSYGILYFVLYLRLTRLDFRVAMASPPSASMIDRDPEPMLARGSTPIHAPTPI